MQGDEMTSARRLLRMMAGDIMSPSERAAERELRIMKREHARNLQTAMLVDKIMRREQRDPDLPPMPLDFEEMKKRGEGK
jgi:hypothetical protein